MGDRGLLDRLALRAATRWTSPAGASGFDGLWLDLGGVDHLHGRVSVLRPGRRLLWAGRRAGLNARTAVEGTLGAAHALARFGGEPIEVVDAGWDLKMVEPLPLAQMPRRTGLLGDYEAIWKRIILLCDTFRSRHFPELTQTLDMEHAR